VQARHPGKFSDCRFDCRLVNTPVTDHESTAVRRLDSERRKGGDVDPDPSCVLSDRTVVNTWWHAQQEVQAGGDALDPQFGQVLGQRCDQAISPPVVHSASTPDMAIVVPAGQELREGELVESRGEVVKEALCTLRLIDEMCGHDEPAKSQCWSQCFRDGSDLYHVLWRNTLECTHRLSVIAELSVVVILDDQPAVRARPGDHVSAPLPAQDTASWELVCRRDEDSVGVETVDDHPLVVDRLRHHIKPDCVDALTRRGLRRIFNGDAGGTAPSEHAHDKIDALRGSLDNHDLGRVGDDPARAAEMIGEHLTEDALSARLAVIESGRPTAPSDVLCGRKPPRQREQRYIRSCWTQVIARRWYLWFRFGPDHVAYLDRSDNWRFALAAEQKPLSHELAVGVTDDATRNAELLSERA